MEKLKNEINTITKIFNFDILQDKKNFYLFLNHIKSISIPDLTICQKEIELGYRCEDCQNDPLSYICSDCFEKNKHQGHHYEILKARGFCDCGDISMVKEEGFCSKHKGYFTSENDMMNYIKKSFEENIIINVNKTLCNIFEIFIEQINLLYNGNLSNEEKNKIENEIYNMLNEFIIFYTKIKENNSALFYLILIKFTENFPFDTTHKCFNYDSEKKIVKIISPSDSQKHKCICPFYQIMMNLLLMRKTVHNNEKFFSSFMLTTKNKLIMSLSFMHIFPEIFYNDNLSIMYKIIFQMCTNEFAELIYEEKNIFFFEEFLNTIKNETIKKLIEIKQYDLLYQLFKSLRIFIELFPTKAIMSKIKLYYKIHSNIIDIICSIHNIITMNKLDEGKYYLKLFDCELSGLITISYLSHLFDFDIIDALYWVFNNFFEKISEVKKIKENKENNIKTYSPFLTLYRSFSILLNRFCFYYSTKNSVDLIIAFNYFRQRFPQFENCGIFLFIFQELINYFGFILYLDKFESKENMILYYKNYFSNNIYILSDITLMRYLLLIPEVQNNFNIRYILYNTDVFSSNGCFVYLDKNKLKRKNKKTQNLISDKKQNLKYINSVLKFIYYIIRDNSSMTYLAFNYAKNFRMKYADEILNILLQKDKDNLYEIIKNKIRINILSKKNLITNNEINNTELNSDLINDIISQVLEEDCVMEINDNVHLYSIKKEKLKFCDIDYCYEKSRLNNLTQYLTEFQANNFNILNTHISVNISIEENLYNNLYDLFFSQENIENFLDFYKNIITYDYYPLLIDIFFFDFSKILCFYIISKGIYNINGNLKLKVTGILNKSKVKGSDIKYIEYMQKLLEVDTNRNNSRINDNNKSNKIDINDIKKKQKERFKYKLKLIALKYGSTTEESKMDIEEEPKEICQYCKKEIDNNNLYNYYGLLINISCDYFIDLIRKKPEKERKKSRRFLPCKHKIHFDCYFKLNQKMDENKNEFKCPVCSKMSNILCDFISLVELNKDITKGMSIGKNNLEEFYTFDEEIMDKSFANINRIFFENYCLKIFKKKIKIENLIENNIIEDILYYLVLDFDTSLIYYNLTKNKKEQIIVWKNILYTFRYLFKSRLIPYTEFIISEFDMVFNDIKNYNIDILNKLNMSYIVDKFIVLLFILYDLSQENKEEIKKIFMSNILILIFFNFYIEKKENLDNFFNDEMTLNKAFELFDLKYTIFLSFFDAVKEENDKYNFNVTINFIKSNELFKNLVEKFEKNNTIIKETDMRYLELPKFNIIELPNNYNDFIERYISINCINCKQNKEKYLICLFCEAKLCIDKQCISKYKEQENNSFMIHAKLCTNYQGLFISNDSRIIFVLKDKIIKSKNFIYLNSHGENYQTNKSHDLKGDYTLRRDILNENIQKYIDMNF